MSRSLCARASAGSGSAGARACRDPHQVAVEADPLSPAVRHCQGEHMLIFATLGHEGSNHHFVLQQYLAAHGIAQACRIVLFDDFHSGARADRRGGGLPASVRRASGRGRDHGHLSHGHGGGRRLHFTQPAHGAGAVQGRRGGRWQGGCAGCNAELMSTFSDWPIIVHEPTVLAVQSGLTEGRYSAGIVFTSFATAHAERFEMVQSIGTVCDAWIVYGRQAVDDGRAVVWDDSPVARHFRTQIERSAESGGS